SYVPEKSEFLRIAESLGKKIINGRAMLFYQAYYSDCYYFNLTPSATLAADLFKKYLKEVVK
ncbi:MAG: shikimate dehydrogenase, partial [Clostridia bacterium]|nr:shikimate dehydrogenase [Clostridia bacterium]